MYSTVFDTKTKTKNLRFLFLSESICLKETQNQYISMRIDKKIKIRID